MSKKLTKEDIKDPDAFISFTDRVVKKLEDSKGAFVGGFVAFLIVSIGYLGFNHYTESNERTAQENLYAIQTAEEKIRENKEAKLEDFKTVIEQYKSFISKNSGTKATYIAAIQLTDIYNKYESFEESVILLSGLTSKIKQSDFFFGLIHTQLGNSAIGLKDFDKATDSFDKIVQNENQKHLHSTSLLRKGLAYQLAGKTDQAKVEYQKITTNYPETSAATSASGYLKLIGLEKAKN